MNGLLQVFAQITVASSAAVLVVAALRRPVRRIAGARVAYWLWLVVPTSVLALWLPVPAHTVQAFAPSLAGSVAGVLSPALTTTSVVASPGTFALAGLLIWASGVLVMAVWLAYRQRRFIRSLGNLTADADGVFRSDRIATPMLVGAWRPRVIVPADFEARYSQEDRTLMLAHERAHGERGDAVVYSLATGAVCISWFNPLMYWALSLLRRDQELACDALVLSRSDASSRRYADALLKAQLLSESDPWLPIGCHWRPAHPLKERITMLKLASPGLSRRLCGIACNVVLTASSMYAVSVCLAQGAVQSAPTVGHSVRNAGTTDRKFSLDAKNTDIRAVLKTIARDGNHNILVSDKVHGRITIHLRGVTWEQALNVVVLSQGLVTRQSGDITMIDVPHGAAN